MPFSAKRKVSSTARTEADRVIVRCNGGLESVDCRPVFAPGLSQLSPEVLQLLSPDYCGCLLPQLLVPDIRFGLPQSRVGGKPAIRRQLKCSTQ